MSSLWTPGGEVPIDRQPSSPTEQASPAEEATTGREAPPAGQSDEDELRRQLLEAPVAAVVAQHAVAFYELAALHLSEPEPRLTEARLAIDALTALLDGLAGRLGDTETALTEALPRLKLAFVEASDRQGRSVD
jgi:hypothetical protein